MPTTGKKIKKTAPLTPKVLMKGKGREGNVRRSLYLGDVSVQFDLERLRRHDRRSHREIRTPEVRTEKDGHFVINGDQPSSSGGD